MRQASNSQATSSRRAAALGSSSLPVPVIWRGPQTLRPSEECHYGSSWVQRTPVAVSTMARDKTAHQLQINKLDQLLQLTSDSTSPATPTAKVKLPARKQSGKPATRPAPDAGSEPASGARSSAAVEQEPIYKPVAASPQPTRLPTPAQSTDSQEYHPSNGWQARPHHLSQAQLWQRLREEAEMDAAIEPALATFLHSVILSHSSMEGAMAFLLANKLADNLMLGAVQLMSLIRDVYAADPSILAAGVADMQAVLDRDPACSKFSQCMLHFKGYQAVQTHRITHYLWNSGRQNLALAIQARASEIFAVDIHPGAQIGRGVMLDHATGIVIGETAVVGDNVSMLHHVSLGGSGTGRQARHPHIGHGVLLGAGVAVVGPVIVGAGSKVGAGSVVVTDLPDHCVAVGVPARIVKRNLRSEPVKEMDQCTDFVLDYVI